MAEIRLSGMKRFCSGGPEMPAEYGVSVKPGPYNVYELHIYLSDNTIIIWPADRQEIRRFAEKLLRVVGNDEIWARQDVVGE